MSKTLQDLDNYEIHKRSIKLKHQIADLNIPESTRWHRNYTDRVDWYYFQNARETQSDTMSDTMIAGVGGFDDSYYYNLWKSTE